MPPRDDPFRAVHRARRGAACVRGLVAVVAIAVGVGLVALADVVPPSHLGDFSAPASAAAEVLETLDDTPLDLASGAEAPEHAAAALPADTAALVSAEPPPAVMGSSDPAAWSIGIDTRGYQVQIDQCLWVRMDLGGGAPIVGAHNYCGGAIVLDMALGDQVALAGAELDAAYVVTDARDARAGDSAPAAIAGMVGDVILQTCYWGGDGRVRLVGLSRAPAA